MMACRRARWATNIDTSKLASHRSVDQEASRGCHSCAGETELPKVGDSNCVRFHSITQQKHAQVAEAMSLLVHGCGAGLSDA